MSPKLVTETRSLNGCAVFSQRPIKVSFRRGFPAIRRTAICAAATVPAFVAAAVSLRRRSVAAEATIGPGSSGHLSAPAPAPAPAALPLCRVIAIVRINSVRRLTTADQTDTE